MNLADPGAVRRERYQAAQMEAWDWGTWGPGWGGRDRRNVLIRRVSDQIFLDYWGETLGSPSPMISPGETSPGGGETSGDGPPS